MASLPQGEAVSRFAPCLIVLMSLHRLFLGGVLSRIARLRFTGCFPCCTQPPKTVKNYLKRSGEFSPPQKSSCRNPGRRGKTIYVPEFGPLAGFDVIMSGRF